MNSLRLRYRKHREQQNDSSILAIESILCRSSAEIQDLENQSDRHQEEDCDATKGAEPRRKRIVFGARSRRDRRSHSNRRACAGSVRAATRSGTSAATRVATNTIAAPTTKGRAPNWRIGADPVSRRTTPAATANPAARPSRAVRDVCFTISRTMCEALAPSAMRMPNSRLRWATRNETTACVPEYAERRPTTPSSAAVTENARNTHATPPAMLGIV